MQYIQLQGQVAADLDLPIEGSYNLFIDTSDNSIKAKDSDGHMHGGGGLSLTELTREELGDLAVSASLTPGAFYKITNAASRSFLDSASIGFNEWNNGTYSGGGNEIQDGGTTIILQAATDKTLSKKGIGLFYVPNYEDPNNPTAPPDYNYKTWDNTHRIYLMNVTGSVGRFDIGSNISLYSNDTENSTTATLEGSLSGTTSGYVTFRLGNNDTFFQDPNNLIGLEISQGEGSAYGYIDGVDYTSSYAPGDCVVYGGRVWQNLSGSIGYSVGGWPDEDLYLNVEDWALVPFDEIHYTIQANAIEYEFEYDNISYRSDGRNEVYSDWKWWDDNWGYNMIKFFPWGHYGTEKVSISNSYLAKFVNFPYDATAWNIKFEDGGGFNAHTWGKQSSFRSIQGDKGAHFTGNDFGNGTVIYDIKLGIQSYMSGIATCDNDYGDNNQIYEVTLGNNANFGDCNMYYGSYIRDVEIGTTAALQYFDMYEYSNIRYGLNLDIDSYMEYFTMNPYSEIKYVKLGIGSRITYFTLNYSSCLKRITLATDSYISNFTIGENSFIRQVNLSDRAYINDFTIGDYGNLQNIDLGAYASMTSFDGGYSTDFQNIRLDASAGIYNVNLGYDCQFNRIQIAPDSSLSNIYGGGPNGGFTGSYLGGITIEPNSSLNDITLGTYSDFNNVSLGTNVYLGGITLEENSGFTNIDLLDDIETGGDILITSGSSFRYSNFGMNGYFNNINITGSSTLGYFDIGSNRGFEDMTFTSSLSNIVITNAFSNLNNIVTQSLNATVGPTDNPLIDFTNRNIITIDITGATNNIGYELGDGEYEGQELTFVAKSDGTHTITADQVNIWSTKLVTSGNGYGLSDRTGTTHAFRPFSRWNGTFWDWRNVTKAIWTGGVWVTDAEQFND